MQHVWSKILFNAISPESMLHVNAAISGEEIVVLNVQELEKKSAEGLKEHLEPLVGVTKFRQRLFLEDNDREIEFHDDAETQNIQLVILPFWTPDVEHEQDIITACAIDDVQTLQVFLEKPLDPNLRISFDDALKGWCLLCLANSYSSPRCVHLLVLAGVEVQHLCRGGRPCGTWSEAGPDVKKIGKDSINAFA